MFAYKFIIEATQERFMEPPLHDVSEHYIVADSYNDAHSHVWGMLNRAGWKVQSIKSKGIFIQDIRNTESQDN